MPPDDPGGAQRPALVGRGYELGLLRASLEGALTRRTQLVEIVGDAGMGKSRLVEELPGLAPQFFFHAATCDRTRSSEPYVPVRSLLRAVAGIPDAADPADAGERLRACLDAVAPELAPVAWLLGAPFGADVGEAAAARGDPARRTDLMHGAVDALLSRTLTMPAVLLFEDAHWMDDASRSLLSYVVGSGVPKPWLICVTRRPEGQPVAEGASKVVLVLAPLSPDAAAAVARSGGGTIHPADLDRIVERSGGNPFFINELVAVGRSSVSALPTSVENIVSSRLSTLTDDERLVIGHAAVVGRSFELGLMRDVLPEVDLEAHLPALTPFVHEIALDRFEFRHDLIQEAAYGLLAPEARRRAHRRLAEAIEGGAESGVEDVAAALAFHFRHAGVWERAWQYGVLAGRAAMGRYANEVAAQSFELALDALAESDFDVGEGVVVEVRESLADVHMLAGRYELAEAEFETLEQMLAGSPTGARIKRKRSQCMIARGRYDNATALLEQALDLRDADERPEMLLDLAGAAFRQGRFERAIECCDEAIELMSSGHDDPRLRARAYYVRETAADFLYGPGTDALRLEALAIFEELGDVEGVIRTANNLGVHAQLSNRWEDALRYYRTAVGLATQIGYIHEAAGTGANIGEILSDQGRLDEALRQFEKALELFAAADSPWGLGGAKRGLGRVAARSGRAAEGEAHLLDAIDELRRIGADQIAIEAEAHLAEAYVLSGRQIEAETRAANLVEDEAVDRSPGLAALLERVRGYAAFQRFEPDVAADHFRRSLELAKRDGALFERALTLVAQAELAERTSLDDPSSLRDRAQAIFDRLGVIAVPEVPLPLTFFEREHRL